MFGPAAGLELVDARSPFQEGEIEIRQVFETEEFGDNLLPETRDRELRMRAEFEAKK